MSRTLLIRRLYSNRSDGEAVVLNEYDPLNRKTVIHEDSPNDLTKIVLCRHCLVLSDTRQLHCYRV